MRSSWPKLAIERLNLLKRWREISCLVMEAAREVIGNSLKGVYVVGSVAEDRITVFSDIDIVLVVDDAKYKNIDVVIDVKIRAEDLGVPFDAPVDVKILCEDEFKNLIGKVYRRVVEVSPTLCQNISK